MASSPPPASRPLSPQPQPPHTHRLITERPTPPSKAQSQPPTVRCLIVESLPPPLRNHNSHPPTPPLPCPPPLPPTVRRLIAEAPVADLSAPQQLADRADRLLNVCHDIQAGLLLSCNVLAGAPQRRVSLWPVDLVAARCGDGCVRECGRGGAQLRFRRGCTIGWSPTGA
eukprot:358439-Chlamydomonas_euryale.AAC.6